MELSLRRNETLPNLDSPVVEQAQHPQLQPPISVQASQDPTPSHVSTFLRNRVRVEPQIKEDKIEEEPGLFLLVLGA